MFAILKEDRTLYAGCFANAIQYFDDPEAAKRWGDLLPETKGTNFSVVPVPNVETNRERQNRDLQANHTIDPNQPYGQHIALTCKNHPNLRWHTKNIDYIGARSIFFSNWPEPECNCPGDCLIVVTP